ncbi:MAG: hypothetical protein ABGX16_02530 [Pirellulales bacterium]
MAWWVFLALVGFQGIPPGEVVACRYTVRDVAMVDLADPHYVLCLVNQGGWSTILAGKYEETASSVLADSNVKLRLLDHNEKSASRVSEIIHALEISSYPAAILLAPDGRTLPLSFEVDALEIDQGKIDRDNAIDGTSSQVRRFRKFLRSVISSPQRQELLHYLLRGHSVMLLVEGTESSNNKRALSWTEDAIERVRDALPTMAKPIELPPRMIRFSPEEAKREEILLWSLGIDSSSSVAQIALLFGRGRKLGPVLHIPGSRQQELWHSLGVVGSDCECGLDRSWMQGTMIPHAWSTVDEAEAVTALGFDPGNPLVKAEISRILARGPSEPGAAGKRLQEPLQPQLQLEEIDIDALVSVSGQATGLPGQATGLSGQAKLSGSRPGQSVLHGESGEAGIQKDSFDQEASAPSALNGGPKEAAAQEDLLDNETSVAQGVFTWVIVTLSLVGILGSLAVVLRGRGN